MPSCSVLCRNQPVSFTRALQLFALGLKHHQQHPITPGMAAVLVKALVQVGRHLQLAQGQPV